MKTVSVICILSAFHCIGATATSNNSIQSDSAIITGGGFGYELLLGKLEDLESKFWNMWLEMKEQNEHIMRNHSRLENTHQGMMWMLTRLEQALGHNLTTVMDRSWEILQQQLSCANHENWKQSVLTMLENTKFVNDSKRWSSLKTFETCSDVPANVSGKFMIHPKGFQERFEAYCVPYSSGGSWLVFQHRFDGSVDFYRNWTEYRNGFGSLDGEFWIGLEKLHRLTKDADCELVVELKDFEGNYAFARYDAFEIGDESKKYSLKKLGNYIGSAGDSLNLHRSMKFSTMDSDNDIHSTNCAQTYRGAWWYEKCHTSNLNGLYQRGIDAKHLCWWNFNNSYDGFAYSRMMVRKK